MGFSPVDRENVEAVDLMSFRQTVDMTRKIDVPAGAGFVSAGLVVPNRPVVGAAVQRGEECDHRHGLSQHTRRCGLFVLGWLARAEIAEQTASCSYFKLRCR